MEKMERAKSFRSEFWPGDEWTYFKVFTDPKTAENILIDILYPLSKEFLSKDIIIKWYYIRYNTPTFHLRIRFHLSNPRFVGQVLNRVFASLRGRADLIHQIEIGTYFRELLRYGEDTIELAEEFFYYDSIAISKLLQNEYFRFQDDQRLFVALRSIDSYLDSFGFTTEQKLLFLFELKTGFGREFGMARPLKKELDEKYRKFREDVELYLMVSESKNDVLKSMEEILTVREENIKPIALEIIGLERTGALGVDFKDLIASYIHMSMNRIFRSKNRLYELVGYDFLHRYYKSYLARIKENTFN